MNDEIWIVLFIQFIRPTLLKDVKVILTGTHQVSTLLYPTDNSWLGILAGILLRDTIGCFGFHGHFMGFASRLLFFVSTNLCCDIYFFRLYSKDLGKNILFSSLNFI
jgi:hypothetical protein